MTGDELGSALSVRHLRKASATGVLVVGLQGDDPDTQQTVICRGPSDVEP
jgi:hypothetical protein